MSMIFMHLRLYIHIFLPLCIFAQSPSYSKYERKWAFFHPFAAVKVKLISKKCYRIYSLQFIRTELDSFSNGGKLDAFRHIFFMGAFAQKVKIKKLRKLGEAHEKANYKMFLNSCKEFGERGDSLGSVMDILNNELAFKMAEQNKKLSLIELQQLVLTEIKHGTAIIVKRKRNGNYLDCRDQIIDLKIYSNRWSVPKCLVKSNYIYID